MKSLMLLLCLLAIKENICAQTKMIVVNPGHNIVYTIPKEDLYAHNEFDSGVVHYKSGKTVEHKMNYNILYDQMKYINSRGDTLILDDTNFDFVTFERDTFYLDDFYFRVLKDYDKLKLVTRKVFAFVNRQKTS